MKLTQYADKTETAKLFNNQIQFNYHKYRYVYLVSFTYKDKKVIKVGVSVNLQNRFYSLKRFAGIKDFKRLYTGKVFYTIAGDIERAFLKTWEPFNLNLTYEGSPDLEPNTKLGITEWHDEFNIIPAIEFLREARKKSLELTQYHGKPYWNYKKRFLPKLQQKYEGNFYNNNVKDLKNEEPIHELHPEPPPELETPKQWLGRHQVSFEEAKREEITKIVKEKSRYKHYFKDSEDLSIAETDCAGEKIFEKTLEEQMYE